MKIRELKRSAKASLKGNWGLAIGAFLVSGVISMVIGFPASRINPETAGYGILTLCINIFIALPLQAGVSWFFLDIYDRANPEITAIFSGFKKYWKVVGASFFVILFVILWSLLLLIPGFIKAFSYSQTIFLIKENPDMEIFEAIKESQRMMKGHKWKYFLTSLSFIGWVIVPIICIIIAINFIFAGAIWLDGSYANLSSVNLAVGMLLLLASFIYTLGISFYLSPYYYTTIAGFYRNLIEQSNSEEEIM